ncbi:MAG: hypothetical protein U9R44_00010 [Candidatus Omnitrophota bacterium]|nr:hypothetical protein [Candidatus Omnitrophota bacterium]
MSSTIPEKLSEFIHEEAERSNYRIVCISTRSRTGFFLEIVLDKEGGITLDECGGFNRKISCWIEAERLFNGRYTLDVCSPGLDRTLKSDSEFSWAAGKLVEVRTNEPVDGRNAIVGKLVKGNTAEGVTLEEENGNTVYIENNNVARTKLKVTI